MGTALHGDGLALGRRHPLSTLPLPDNVGRPFPLDGAKAEVGESNQEFVAFQTATRGEFGREREGFGITGTGKGTKGGGETLGEVNPQGDGA